MLEINYRKFIFTLKQIWFADFPYDVTGVSRVIFRDCKNKIDAPGFYREEHLTFVIDLNKNTEEIFSTMSSTCRYEIRRAEREKITIGINQNFEEFVIMEKLFNKTKKLLARGSMTINFMKKYGVLFVAKIENQIIGGQFYLVDENNMRLLSAPSKRLNMDSGKSAIIGMANRLMTWQAIQYAKAKGIKEFDFGGYHAGGMHGEILDTPSRFKQSFGGKKISHYVYQKDYSKIYTFLSYLKKYTQ